MAEVQLANSRCGFCRRNGLFDGGIVVLGLALIWAARMVVADLEFISAGELER